MRRAADAERDKDDNAKAEEVDAKERDAVMGNAAETCAADNALASAGAAAVTALAAEDVARTRQRWDWPAARETERNSIAAR